MKKRVVTVFISLGAIIFTLTLAQAQASVKSEEVTYNVLNYSVVLIISTVAGALTSLRDYLEDDKKDHRALRTAYAILGAMFVGILTYWVCLDYGLGLLKTNYIVALSAYGGIGSIRVVMSIIRKQQQTGGV